MPRKASFIFIALLATLVLAPVRSQAITVTFGNFWTSDFIGCVRGYIYNDQVAVTRVHLAGDTWQINLASNTGALNVYLDDSFNFHSVLTTNVLYSDTSTQLVDEPGVATFDATYYIYGGFSVGASVIDSNDGVTVLYSTGTNDDGSITELPITRGSIFIAP